MNDSTAVRKVPADKGSFVSMVGDTYHIVVSGKDTGGEYASIDMLIPPGGGPGPHAHAGFHETFYVVEGEVEFASENGRFTAATGDCVTIPKGGAVHSFKNRSQRLAHLLCTVAPAGLEELFLELGTPVAAGEFLPPPDMHDPAIAQRFREAAERHQQTLYPPDYLDRGTISR